MDPQAFSLVGSSSSVFKSAEVPLENQAGSALAVDVLGRWAAVGNKSGIALIDLEQPHNTPQYLQHQNIKFDVNVLEWSPHTASRDILASSFNQSLLIWRVDGGLQASYPSAHARAVSDLSFSRFDPNMVASASPDMMLRLWDLRASSSTANLKVKGPISFLKFSKVDEYLIASAHVNEVHVWDIRRLQGQGAVAQLFGHSSKITSLDWSPSQSQSLLTSSADGFIKLWSVPSPRFCQQTISFGQPIFRAKYTPFGLGVLAIAQRRDTTLRLFRISGANEIADVHTFAGHSDFVKAFDWRICQSDLSSASSSASAFDPNSISPAFQLVSLGCDQSLRLWRVDADVASKVGYQYPFELPEESEIVAPPSALSAARASGAFRRFEALGSGATAPASLTSADSVSSDFPLGADDFGNGTMSISASSPSNFLSASPLEQPNSMGRASKFGSLSSSFSSSPQSASYISSSSPPSASNRMASSPATSHFRKATRSLPFSTAGSASFSHELSQCSAAIPHLAILKVRTGDIASCLGIGPKSRINIGIFFILFLPNLLSA